MTMQRVCSVDEIESGTAQQFNVSGVEVALCRDEDGSYHAISAMCTHGEVPLAEGDVYEGKVECWAHGATFDLCTGQPTMPATQAVTVYPVSLDGDDVLVDVAS